MSETDAESLSSSKSDTQSRRSKVILELVETEGLHVIKLLTIRDILAKPVAQRYRQSGSQAMVAELSHLFLNSDKFVEIHGDIYEKLFADFSADRPPERTLFEIFHGPTGAQLEAEMGFYCAHFCLDAIRGFRGDRRLSYVFSPERQREFHGSLANNTVEDLLAAVFQRPMQYPLLIERLLDTLEPGSPEWTLAERSLSKCQQILANVNHAVLQKNFRLIFGKTVVKNGVFFNTRGKTVIHLGLLKWKVANDKVLNVCLVLTKKEIVILEAKPTHYVLRQYRRPDDPLNTCFDPILRLQDSLARNNACDPNSFYLLSGEQRAIFELFAPSVEERDRWTQAIGTATRMLAKTSLESPAVSRRRAPGGGITISQIVDHHPDLAIHVSSAGRTPFHHACAAGMADIVELFIANGADTAAVDDDGNAAVHYAVFGGSAKVLRLLLDSGKADVNCLNGKQRSPLHIAVIVGSVDCVKLLTERNCDVNRLDLYGNSPLDYAYKMCGLFEGDSNC